MPDRLPTPVTPTSFNLRAHIPITSHVLCIRAMECSNVFIIQIWVGTYADLERPKATELGRENKYCRPGVPIRPTIIFLPYNYLYDIYVCKINGV